MRNVKLLRTLLSLNLVIFLLPFLNTCSGKPSKSEFQQDLHAVESSPHLSTEEKREAIDLLQASFIDRLEQYDAYTFNAYELGIVLPFKEFQLESLEKLFFYSLLGFTFQMASVVLMFWFLWRNKLHPIRYLILWNIVVLTLALSMMVLDGGLETVDQLKIGLFIYVLNLGCMYLVISRMALRFRMQQV